MERSVNMEKGKTFEVREDAIVVGNRTGKVVRIGLDGMEYLFYDTDERDVKIEPYLTVLVEKDGFVIYKIPYVTDSKSESSEIDENGNPVKRNKVKFADLSTNQICQIEYFIKRYTF